MAEHEVFADVLAADPAQHGGPDLVRVGHRGVANGVAVFTLDEAVRVLTIHLPAAIAAARRLARPEPEQVPEQGAAPELEQLALDGPPRSRVVAP